MLSAIYEAIGNWLGEESHLEDLGDPLDFESGLCLDFGISWIYFFKKLLIPREYRTQGRLLCPSRCSDPTLKKCKT